MGMALTLISGSEVESLESRKIESPVDVTASVESADSYDAKLPLPNFSSSSVDCLKKSLSIDDKVIDENMEAEITVEVHEDLRNARGPAALPPMISECNQSAGEAACELSMNQNTSAGADNHIEGHEAPTMDAVVRRVGPRLPPCLEPVSTSPCKSACDEDNDAPPVLLSEVSVTRSRNGIVQKKAAFSGYSRVVTHSWPKPRSSLGGKRRAQWNITGTSEKMNCKETTEGTISSFDTSISDEYEESYDSVDPEWDCSRRSVSLISVTRPQRLSRSATKKVRSTVIPTTTASTSEVDQQWETILNVSSDLDNSYQSTFEEIQSNLESAYRREKVQPSSSCPKIRSTRCRNMAAKRAYCFDHPVESTHAMYLGSAGEHVDVIDGFVFVSFDDADGMISYTRSTGAPTLVKKIPPANSQEHLASNSSDKEVEEVAWPTKRRRTGSLGNGNILRLYGAASTRPDDCSSDKSICDNCSETHSRSSMNGGMHHESGYVGSTKNIVGVKPSLPTSSRLDQSVRRKPRSRQLVKFSAEAAYSEIRSKTLIGLLHSSIPVYPNKLDDECNSIKSQPISNEGVVSGDPNFNCTELNELLSLEKPLRVSIPTPGEDIASTVRHCPPVPEPARSITKVCTEFKRTVSPRFKTVLERNLYYGIISQEEYDKAANRTALRCGGQKCDYGYLYMKDIRKPSRPLPCGTPQPNLTVYRAGRCIPLCGVLNKSLIERRSWDKNTHRGCEYFVYNDNRQIHIRNSGLWTQCRVPNNTRCVVGSIQIFPEGVKRKLGSCYTDSNYITTTVISRQRAIVAANACANRFDGTKKPFLIAAAGHKRHNGKRRMTVPLCRQKRRITTIPSTRLDNIYDDRFKKRQLVLNKLLEQIQNHGSQKAYQKTVNGETGKNDTIPYDRSPIKDGECGLKSNYDAASPVPCANKVVWRKLELPEADDSSGVVSTLKLSETVNTTDAVLTLKLSENGDAPGVVPALKLPETEVTPDVVSTLKLPVMIDTSNVASASKLSEAGDINTVSALKLSETNDASVVVSTLKMSETKDTSDAVLVLRTIEPDDTSNAVLTLETPESVDIPSVLPAFAFSESEVTSDVVQTFKLSAIENNSDVVMERRLPETGNTSSVIHRLKLSSDNTSNVVPALKVTVTKDPPDVSALKMHEPDDFSNTTSTLSAPNSEDTLNVVPTLKLSEADVTSDAVSNFKLSECDNTCDIVQAFKRPVTKDTSNVVMTGHQPEAENTSSVILELKLASNEGTPDVVTALKVPEHDDIPNTTSALKVSEPGDIPNTTSALLPASNLSETDSPPIDNPSSAVSAFDLPTADDIADVYPALKLSGLENAPDVIMASKLPGTEHISSGMSTRESSTENVYDTVSVFEESTTDGRSNVAPTLKLHELEDASDVSMTLNLSETENTSNAISALELSSTEDSCKGVLASNLRETEKISDVVPALKVPETDDVSDVIPNLKLAEIKDTLGVVALKLLPEPDISDAVHTLGSLETNDAASVDSLTLVLSETDYVSEEDLYSSDESDIDFFDSVYETSDGECEDSHSSVMEQNSDYLDVYSGSIDYQGKKPYRVLSEPLLEQRHISASQPLETTLPESCLTTSTVSVDAIYQPKSSSPGNYEPITMERHQIGLEAGKNTLPGHGTSVSERVITPIAANAESGSVCKQTFCRLGCVCDSLVCRKIAKQHCNHPCCMFNSICTNTTDIELKTNGKVPLIVSCRQAPVKFLPSCMPPFEEDLLDDIYSKLRKEVKVKLTKYAFPNISPYCLFHRISNCSIYNVRGDCYIGARKRELAQLGRNIVRRPIPLCSRTTYVPRTRKKLASNMIVLDQTCVITRPMKSVTDPDQLTNAYLGTLRLKLPDPVDIESVAKVVVLYQMSQQGGLRNYKFGIFSKDGAVTMLNSLSEASSIPWSIKDADGVVVFDGSGRSFRNRSVETDIVDIMSPVTIIRADLPYVNSSIRMGHISLDPVEIGSLTLFPCKAGARKGNTFLRRADRLQRKLLSSGLVVIMMDGNKPRLNVIGTVNNSDHQSYAAKRADLDIFHSWITLQSRIFTRKQKLRGASDLQSNDVPASKQASIIPLKLALPKIRSVQSDCSNARISTLAPLPAEPSVQEYRLAECEQTALTSSSGSTGEVMIVTKPVVHSLSLGKVSQEKITRTLPFDGQHQVGDTSTDSVVHLHVVSGSQGKKGVEDNENVSYCTSSNQLLGRSAATVAFTTPRTKVIPLTAGELTTSTKLVGFPRRTKVAITGQGKCDDVSTPDNSSLADQARPMMGHTPAIVRAMAAKITPKVQKIAMVTPKHQISDESRRSQPVVDSSSHVNTLSATESSHILKLPHKPSAQIIRMRKASSPEIPCLTPQAPKVSVSYVPTRPSSSDRIPTDDEVRGGAVQPMSASVRLKNTSQATGKSNRNIFPGRATVVRPFRFDSVPSVSKIPAICRPSPSVDGSQQYGNPVFKLRSSSASRLRHEHVTNLSRNAVKSPSFYMKNTVNVGLITSSAPGGIDHTKMSVSDISTTQSDTPGMASKSDTSIRGSHATVNQSHASTVKTSTCGRTGSPMSTAKISKVISLPAVSNHLPAYVLNDAQMESAGSSSASCISPTGLTEGNNASMALDNSKGNPPRLSFVTTRPERVKGQLVKLVFGGKATCFNKVSMLGLPDLMHIDGIPLSLTKRYVKHAVNTVKISGKPSTVSIGSRVLTIIWMRRFADYVYVGPVFDLYKNDPTPLYFSRNSKACATMDKDPLAVPEPSVEQNDSPDKPAVASSTESTASASARGTAIKEENDDSDSDVVILSSCKKPPPLEVLLLDDSEVSDNDFDTGTTCDEAVREVISVSREPTVSGSSAVSGTSSLPDASAVSGIPASSGTSALSGTSAPSVGELCAVVGAGARKIAKCPRKGGSAVLVATGTAQPFASTAQGSVSKVIRYRTKSVVDDMEQPRELISHTYCKKLKTVLTGPSRGRPSRKSYIPSAPTAPKKLRHSWSGPSTSSDADRVGYLSGSVDQSQVAAVSASPKTVGIRPVSPQPLNPTIVSVVGADGTSFGHHSTVMSTQQRKQRRQKFTEAKSTLETVLFGRIENSAIQIRRPPELTLKQAIEEVSHLKTHQRKLKLQVWRHAQKQRDLIKRINTQVGQLPLEKRIEKVAEIEELLPFLQVSIGDDSESGEPIMSLEKKTSEQVSQFRVIAHSEASQQTSVSQIGNHELRIM